MYPVPHEVRSNVGGMCKDCTLIHRYIHPCTRTHIRIRHAHLYKCLTCCETHIAYIHTQPYLEQSRNTISITCLAKCKWYILSTKVRMSLFRCLIQYAVFLAAFLHCVIIINVIILVATAIATRLVIAGVSGSTFWWPLR